MKSIFFSFCFFIFSCFSLSLVSAQQTPIKEFEKELKTLKSDSDRVNFLNKIGEDFLNEGNFQNAHLILNEALNLALKNKLESKVILIYQNKGNVFSDEGNNEAALYQYNLALSRSKQSNNKIGIAQSLNLIGIINQNQGYYLIAIDIFKKALTINKAINNKKGLEKNHTNIGNSYFYMGNYISALINHEAALSIAKQLKDNKLISNSLNNISICYISQGNYTEALNYLLSSLKLNEATGNKRLLADNYLNISLIYYYQKNYEEALNYQEQSIKINKELANKRDIALNLTNISSIYFELNNFEAALKNENEALAINREIDNKNGIAKNYRNIGNMYLKEQKYSNALESFRAALKIDEDLLDREGISVSNCNIAEVYTQQKKYEEARNILTKSIKITLETANKVRIKELYYALAKLDSLQGVWKGAYINYRLYTVYRDSLINEVNTKKLVQSQMEYNFDKKQTADKLKQATKDALVIEEKKRQKTITIAVSFGFILVLVFSMLMLNRFRVTLKQKRIIENQKKKVETQKELIEEKNKQVTDSIKYAKRIQTAIIPPPQIFKNRLPDSFIFYLPKDIVAGDFYWQEKINNLVLFAACDCTGHGVPGAMVSVVCNNALNRAVREFNLVTPGDILNKTLEIVIENFLNSEDEIRDGMDISLCSYDAALNQLQYAGANNSLWIIRNNEFIEIKANKQAIGNNDNVKPFTNHVIQLIKGDLLYLSTDGYSDQFGGVNGRKKLTKKRFKELLLSVHKLPIEEQGKKLETFFYEYKQNIEQIDDILVIGKLI